MSDPVPELIERAFRATCEAEKIIYAAGASRESKDHIITAHSHLLALRDLYPLPARVAVRS